jgi:hypothetical protein
MYSAVLLAWERPVSNILDTRSLGHSHASWVSGGARGCVAVVGGVEEAVGTAQLGGDGIM